MTHLSPLKTMPPWIPCTCSVSAGPLVLLWVVCTVHVSHVTPLMHSSIL